MRSVTWFCISIHLQPTRKDQAAALLELLLRKDNNTFISFYNSLVKETYDDLANLLYDDLPRACPDAYKNPSDGYTPYGILKKYSVQNVASIFRNLLWYFESMKVFWQIAFLSDSPERPEWRRCPTKACGVCQQTRAYEPDQRETLPAAEGPWLGHCVWNGWLWKICPGCRGGQTLQHYWRLLIY